MNLSQRSRPLVRAAANAVSGKASVLVGQKRTHPRKASTSANWIRTHGRCVDETAGIPSGGHVARLHVGYLSQAAPSSLHLERL